MGGAADLPQRSSSPLKRPASDLEAVAPSSQKDDVDMIPVPSSEPTEQAQESTQLSRVRAQTADMLQDEEHDKGGEAATTVPKKSAVPPKSAETQFPPVDAQIKTVTTIYEAAAEHQPNEGDRVYLVSRRWLNRVISRGSDARKSSKVEPEGEIGPVDNSDIVQQIIKDAFDKDFVQLKHGMGTEHFVLFPKEAWDLVMEWYGLMSGTLPIERIAHNTNPDKNGIPNVQFEFNPPIFKVHRLHSENGIIHLSQKLKATNPPALVFVLSQSTKYHEFLRKVKLKTQVEMGKKIRVWRVPRLQPAAEPIATGANTATPPSSRPSSPAPGDLIGPLPRAPQDSWTQMLLDVPSFTQLQRQSERELVDFPDHSANSKYNGNMDLAMAGLGEDQTIVLDEHINGDNYVSNYVPKGAMSTATSNRSLAPSNSQTNSGRNSPAPSGPMTRGRSQKVGKPLGAVGLSNLGNTCYMNSALQCVRSVEELTKYFLVGAARNELNVDNPLGNHGEVAVAYEKLLSEIYRDNPPNSVAPRYFKTTIGRYAPAFSGYGQQDSQEFLGFLLDGLQEDLSRVKKKPYIEKPDSTDEMVNDPEAIREMAAKVWDITKKRDDSVIADLFTGMYKSTLVCPVCAKVSITFDPFNNLTLQLPIENSWSHQVYYFPLNDRPVQITVDIDKNASIGAMKEFISSRVNIPVERLFAAEEFKSKFYKVYDDAKVASEEISSNDNIMVYELEAKPTNWPPRKKPKKPKKSIMFTSSYHNNDSGDEDDVPHWDDPMAERMILPVFHRRPNNTERNTRYSNRKPWTIEPVPHFIMLTSDEAKSEDMIKRKILEKIATFSTHPEFEEEYDASTSVADSADADIVITTGSDADSSGGSKVFASSIDGEDELVDVTMKDSLPKTSASPFNTRRPKFVTPGSFLTPSLQNMFDVGFFSGSKEMIPSGWNVVDDDKAYQNIKSRAPQSRPSQDDEAGNDLQAVNGGDQSESSDDDPSLGNSVSASTTRMVEEESSDEDAAPQSVAKVLPVRPAGPKSGVRVGFNKRRPRGIKTYSKKGTQSAGKLQDLCATESEASDQGPLVRLGEGLVVDWNQDAWNAMYCKDGPDDNMRGEATWSKMPPFDDPELAAKRAARAQRRKNGITLDDCLNEFGKEEILSEMDTWYCPRCKEHRRASKKFELWKTPDILVMHLKRFSSSGMRRDKLDVHVDFPIEGLDLSSRVIETEEGKQEIYDLFAVDDHWGGLGGGHYTAFAKNFYDNEWWEYNDSSAVKQKDASRVVSPSAYLLFYRRRSDVPLGGPRFQQIFRDFENPPEPLEDDASESGEDQGLVGNYSSLRGSSSALTGVGAARHQLNGSVNDEGTTTINPSALEKLHAYEAHEGEEDAAPLLIGDAAMNDGFGLHASIEDEGVDMSMGFNELNYSNRQGLLSQNWNFDPLRDLGSNSRGDQMISGTGSDVDVASDIVQNNSSASEGSIRGRLDDFNNATAEDDGIPFEDQSPVPDLDEDGQASAIALQADLLETMQRGLYPRQEFEVTADDERFEVEEPAVEIHVKDNEDLKMD